MSETTEASPEEVLAETLAHLTPTAVDGGQEIEAPSWFGDHLFGGFVVAQAIAAAARWAPEGRRVHSLHAYFLRPVRAGVTVRYEGTMLREGRSFATLRLDAAQEAKSVLAATVSFTADTEGYVYDLGSSDALPDRDESELWHGPGPWVSTPVGPSEPLADGTRTSTHRAWFRIPGRLADDVHLHTSLLGFASDWTGTGGRPLHLDGDTQGMISLDHAVWFHRPCRVDDWLFYDVQSLVNAGGRGLLRGVMRDGTGRVVVSMAQEMLLLPVPS